jgi:hypothetical protein
MTVHDKVLSTIAGNSGLPFLVVCFIVADLMLFLILLKVFNLI